jgi:mRNA-degrading endonuclease RelE of RelBE toxin-antitoxin system
MYQIIFNKLSAAEMAALPKELQLDLLAEFEVLPDDLDELDPQKFGKLARNGRTIYRYRAREHRIYFERRPEGITVLRVLHKNTLQDFLFRSSLSSGEDEQLSQKDGFWELIEAGAKAGKAK